LEDLIHEGYLGLIHAIGLFRPRGGTRLISYAVWWIRHYMWKAIAAQRGPIGLPPQLLQRVRTLRNSSRRLSEHLLREPTVQELALAMGLSVAQIRTLLHVGGETLSTDFSRPDPAPPETPAEFLADSEQPTPLEHLTVHSLHHALRDGLRRLGRREADVLRLHYGLDGTPPRTLESIGRRWKLSGERVRQMERNALQKLRNLL
jgi:RNA polymerase sigma factor (sigma-70 family)